MTKNEQRAIIQYLVDASWTLGNLDSTEEWGWDGFNHANALMKQWKVDFDDISQSR